MAQKKAQEIELSSAEREILERLVIDPCTPEKLAVRMKIVLMAAEGRANYEIERTLHLPHGKAKKWRDRYAHHHEELVRVEKEADYKLWETIDTILSDAKRRVGAPPIVRKFKRGESK